MKVRYLIALVASVTVLTACFKQSPPDIEPDYRSGISDQRRLEACSVLSFGDLFLEKDNVIALFQCSRWDVQFPDLFKAIEKIEKNRWSDVTRPIGDEFFDNRARRDRVIRYLQDLDEAGALDDIGHILSAINEINFYSAWKLLFECMKDKSSSKCRDRNYTEIQYEDIESIIKVLDQPEKTWRLLSRVFDGLNRGFRSDQGRLRNAIREFYRTEAFSQIRLELTSTVLKAYENGIRSETIDFLNAFFGHDEHVQEVFIYYLLNYFGITEGQFEDLITYFVKIDPVMFKDIKVLNRAIRNGIDCEPSSETRYFKFDFLEESQLLSEILARGNQNEAFDVLLSRVATLRSAEPFCPPLRSYSDEILSEKNEREIHRLSFIQLLNRTSNYLVEEERFELTSFLSRISSPLTDQDHLVSLIGSDVFHELNRMNKVITEESPEFFKSLFSFIKTFERENFEDFSNLVKLLNEEKTRDGLASISRVWTFFKPVEQEFLFRLIDHHLDEGIHFTELISFYAKIFAELGDSAETFNSHWFNSRDSVIRLRLSFEAFANVFAGEAVLRDFRRFYSRDHIVEVIKILTRGMSLVEERLREYEYLYSDNYLSTVLLPSRTSTDPRVPLRRNCISSLSNEGADLYTLISDFPVECEGSVDVDISLSFLSWMANIQTDFKRRYGATREPFGTTGILSPRLLGELVAQSKILDDVVSGGLAHLVSRVMEHLFELPWTQANKTGFVAYFESIVNLLDATFKLDDNYTQELRNSIIKKRLIDEGGPQNVYKNFLKNYSHWLTENYSETSIESNTFFSCARYLNQNIGYKCPRNSREAVSSVVPIIEGLIKKHNNRGETPLDMFYDAFWSLGGVNIPLDKPNPRLYRLSFAETLEMLHRKVDKTRDVNRLSVPFQLSLNQSVEDQLMTTLERIEVVIRDVRFGDNYLGVQYMNYVAHGEDYNSDVNNRKSMLRNCIRLPVIRCGRSMSRDERREASNALEAFDGLLDINNGRGLDSGMTYGDYMTALLAVIVGSSPIEAQRVQLLPLRDEALRVHNGKLLGHITAAAGFSHLGRWIHDRIGTRSEDINGFISSYAVAHLDRTFLQNTPRHLTKASLEKMLTGLITPYRGTQRPIDDMIEWLYSQSREDLIRLERILGRFFVVFSHIGDEGLILQQESSGRYSENSLYSYIQLIELAIENWSTFNRVFRATEIEKLILRLEPLSVYLYNQLNDSATRESAYIFVNELTLLYRDLLTNFHESARIVDKGEGQYRGLEVLKKGFREVDYVRKLNDVIRGTKQYLMSVDHDSGGDNRRGRWLKDVLETWSSLAEDERGSVEPWNDYLLHTTRNALCVREGSCSQNPHYDELALFVDYLAHRKNGISNFERASRVLYDKRDNLEEFLSRVMSGITLGTR